MKILNRQQIREADAYTIQHDPIASIDLMERAAGLFVKRLLKKIKNTRIIHIFCGKGNNGGDGLVAARLLIQKNFSVKTYIVEYSHQSSADFAINFERLKELESAEIIHLDQDSDFPLLDAEDTLIDAMWGSGLSRPIEGFACSIIENINNSQAEIIALDIPSGLFCDELNSDPAIVQADHVISFQSPKLSFFIPENQDYVKSWECVDIGLNQDFINKLETTFQLTEPSEIKQLFRPRDHFDHKGKFGHALLISGSLGKMGAAVLASSACIRSGIGLITVNVPMSGNAIIQTAVPEAMSIPDPELNHISQSPDLQPYTAVGIGPGIGTNTMTVKAFQTLLEQLQLPLVIDADGINILSLNPGLLKLLPAGSILSPHIGEFDRLAGKSDHHYQRLEKLIQWAKKLKSIIILKGRYTAIANSDGQVYFNPTGNPGMATAGSGDVLTGMILAFVAQSYPLLTASKIAVYLHGLAGDSAAKKLTETSLKAGDINSHIPKAIKKLLK
ncbi:MAG: NAD(P)H-hydrate dehydratase [Bacteroidetes bacterium]|nr:NAD(P)H-hydrate dehydratase [Bacteroidota bacterium]